MTDFAATKPEQKTRLESLRAQLRAGKLDGFFVPLADEYLNEYVPDYAQRLAWLTGFTGSAGLGVVLVDHATLFVDGRYTLQAAEQVDAQLYEIRHISKKPLSDYIKEHVSAGKRIGYDPWLHSASWVERNRKAIEEAGGLLIATYANPIDPLWQNRPAVPCAPVFAQPESLAGEASSLKRARVGKALAEKGLDAAVLCDPASVAWLLNVRGGDVESSPLPLSFAILHGNSRVQWFVDPAKTKNLKIENGIEANDLPAFVKALQKLGAAKSKVRVDQYHTASAIVDALRQSGAEVDIGADPCELPKACKNGVEVAGIRAAHIRDGLALSRFLGWLGAQAPGSVDEIAAQEKLLGYRKLNNGFQYPSFPSISGAGPHGAIVHYKASAASNRVLGDHELYLIDSGGQYPDGTTDVTRTVAIGTPSTRMREDFTRVLKGHIALASVRFPAGTTGAQLDVLARQFLWQAGLDYDHGTGHGVGAFLNVHEGPQGISSRAQTPLQAGMVISNEPGFYLAGQYGIRIENLVVVVESEKQLDGKPMLEFETLTLAPIDRNAIEVGMLNTAEKEWLNAYHKRVYDAHAAFLEGAEKEWLKAATAPL